MQTLHPLKRLLLAGVMAVTAAAATATAQASLKVPNEIDLNINLATPVMEANKRHKAFIKISLEGFKQQGHQQRIPANVAIVLDKSGSMAGDKIAHAREAYGVVIDERSLEIDSAATAARREEIKAQRTVAAE